MKKLLAGRKGQTTVEYVLTTAALLVVFISLYKFFNWYVPAQFKAGSKLILSVYQVTLTDI